MKSKLFRLRIKATCFEEIKTDFIYDAQTIQNIISIGGKSMKLALRDNNSIIIGEDLIKQCMIFVEEKP